MSCREKCAVLAGICIGWVCCVLPFATVFSISMPWFEQQSSFNLTNMNCTDPENTTPASYSLTIGLWTICQLWGFDVLGIRNSSGHEDECLDLSDLGESDTMQDLVMKSYSVIGLLLTGTAALVFVWPAVCCCTPEDKGERCLIGTIIVVAASSILTITGAVLAATLVLPAQKETLSLLFQNLQNTSNVLACTQGHEIFNPDLLKLSYGFYVCLVSGVGIMLVPVFFSLMLLQDWAQNKARRSARGTTKAGNKMPPKEEIANSSHQKKEGDAQTQLQKKPVSKKLLSALSKLPKKIVHIFENIFLRLSKFLKKIKSLF